jgi:hypothetical protein
VTRADLGSLAIFEAVMLPLAVFGPTGGSRGFAALLACAAVAALVSRFFFGAQRERPECSAPMLLSFAVALVVALAVGAALRWGGLDGEGALGAVLGFMLTAFTVTDRWWAARSVTPPAPAPSE